MREEVDFVNDETQTLKSSAENIYNDDLGNSVLKDENGILIENVKEYFAQKSENRVGQAIKKYTPIGSVVRVNEKIGLYMIIGYKCCQDGTLFDYSAVKYPEGATNNAVTYVFNHNEITEFHHIGMQNGIQKAYKEKLLQEDGV